jgi:hypothetical protein
MAIPMSPITANKKNITNRLLAAWEKAPHLRLGQLIENSLDEEYKDSKLKVSLFYTNDDKLVELVERYVKNNM